MWTQGAIGIPSGNGGMTSVSYWVKHYDNESQFGIDNGRISKLTQRGLGRARLLCLHHA